MWKVHWKCTTVEISDTIENLNFILFFVAASSGMVSIINIVNLLTILRYIVCLKVQGGARHK